MYKSVRNSVFLFIGPRYMFGPLAFSIIEQLLYDL